MSQWFRHVLLIRRVFYASLVPVFVLEIEISKKVGLVSFLTSGRLFSVPLGFCVVFRSPHTLKVSHLHRLRSSVDVLTDNLRQLLPVVDRDRRVPFRLTVFSRLLTIVSRTFPSDQVTAYSSTQSLTSRCSACASEHTPCPSARIS